MTCVALDGNKLRRACLALSSLFSVVVGLFSNGLLYAKVGGFGVLFEVSGVDGPAIGS